MVAMVDEFKVLEKVRAADDGTLTLPPEVREVLKFKSGEELMLFETTQGVLISTKKRIVNWALDSIGAELRERRDTGRADRIGARDPRRASVGDVRHPCVR